MEPQNRSGASLVTRNGTYELKTASQNSWNSCAMSVLATGASGAIGRLLGECGANIYDPCGNASTRHSGQPSSAAI